MRVYKSILICLFLLISISLIFSRPGISNLEILNEYINKYEGYKNIHGIINNFIKYPSGSYILLAPILQEFKLNKQVTSFNRQVVWQVHKLLLFLFYIFTWLSILYLCRKANIVRKASLLDVTLAYLATIPIIHISLGLSYFDIFGAPFFVLSLAFLIKQKFILSGIFYISSLLFSWTLIIISPLYIFKIWSHNKFNLKEQILPFIAFIFTPLFITFATIGANFNYFVLSLNPNNIQILGVPWLIANLLKKDILISINPIIVLLLVTFFLVSFISVYLQIFRTKNNSFSKLLLLSQASYLILIIFFPGLNGGNLLWLSLLSLIGYLFYPSQTTPLHLLYINLLIFIDLFVFFGISGIPPVKGDFFELFKYLFSALFLAFAIWYINSIFKFVKIDTTSSLKKMLIILVVALNLSLVPASGSGDHVSWSQYALAATQSINPFQAYTEVILQYPPLSIAIIGFFANLWKLFIGVSTDYSIAIKISILVFYFLTAFYLIRSKIFSEGEGVLGSVDKLLIILSTFSIIIQTQGLADINIYVIPTLFASIITLFANKYLLSGILMGITISIKWQPIILLPLFFISIVNLRYFKNSLKRLSLFLSGFLPIILIIWLLVVVNPGSFEDIKRSFKFILYGAAAFSGQALNLNWIVTYFMHIFQYNGVESLAHLEGLNRQVGTNFAPMIFQGYLFIIAFLAISFKYWLRDRKDLIHFLSASVMIFFSHHQLNKSAYEKHLFYVVVLMLFLYLFKMTRKNRMLLILFDIMTVMNLVFFYGFTGSKDVDRILFGFDLTVLFSLAYSLIFLWVFYQYLSGKILTD